MKIMVDSNIVIFAVLFPHGYVSLALMFALEDDTVIIPQNVKDEVLHVSEKKFPDKVDDVIKFIESGLFVIENPKYSDVELDVSIRDVKDVPVFLSAKAIGVDVLMTGDKDLLEIHCRKTMILSPKEYLLVKNKLS